MPNLNRKIPICKSKSSFKEKYEEKEKENNEFDQKIFNNLSLKISREKSPLPNKIKIFTTFFSNIHEQIFKNKQIHCTAEKEIIEEKKEKIAIIFKRDIDEKLLVFNLDMSVKEMLNKYLEKYSSIKNLDNDTIFFIFQSRILNNPHFLEKSLKSVFRNRQNSIVNVILPGSIICSK